MCKATFVVQDAVPRLPKLAELRLVEKIRGPQLILAVSKAAFGIIALSSLEEDAAQPGAGQVRA